MKQVQGERLGLHRCEIGTSTLSPMLFINLHHPLRSCSDPHSSSREEVAFLSLLDTTASHNLHLPEPNQQMTPDSENHRQIVSFCIIFTGKGTLVTTINKSFIWKHILEDGGLRYGLVLSVILKWKVSISSCSHYDLTNG